MQGDKDPMNLSHIEQAHIEKTRYVNLKIQNLLHIEDTKMEKSNLWQLNATFRVNPFEIEEKERGEERSSPGFE